MTNILTMFSASHIVQGIIVGAVFAFLTAQIIMNIVAKAMTTTVKGWSITSKCGQPGNGILIRAVCARNLPAVNVVQEAAYWRTLIVQSCTSKQYGTITPYLHLYISCKEEHMARVAIYLQDK